MKTKVVDMVAWRAAREEMIARIEAEDPSSLEDDIPFDARDAALLDDIPFPEEPNEDV